MKKTVEKVEKSGLMFEGKHIHFSPVDNKPLCSYSSKLCRQRRLNGYAFCIRHILEDTSAPFKRCTYVTRNNNQICQNAIPTSQDRGYCHSHMQVAGIIPKTERKVKNPQGNKGSQEGGPAKGDSSSSSNGSTSGQSQGLGSVPSNSNTSQSQPPSNGNGNGGGKKDPNAVFKFEEEPTEIQWIPKGGRINGLVNGGKSKGVRVQNGKIVNGVAATATSPSTNAEKGKQAKVGSSEGVSVNGSAAETGESPNPAPSPNPRSGRRNQAKLVRQNSVDAADGTQPVTQPPTNDGEGGGNNGGKLFDQLKTLKSVERSVSSTCNAGVPAPPEKQCKSPRTVHSHSPSPNGVGPPYPVVTLFNASIYAQKKLLNCTISPDSCESRQEYLARIRRVLKSQYSLIKSAAQDSDKNEKIWKRALRNSLLTCIVKDSSFSAHVLVQNDPIKYSEDEESDKVRKRRKQTVNGKRAGERLSLTDELLGSSGETLDESEESSNSSCTSRKFQLTAKQAGKRNTEGDDGSLQSNQCKKKARKVIESAGPNGNLFHATLGISTSTSKLGAIAHTSSSFKIPTKAVEAAHFSDIDKMENAQHGNGQLVYNNLNGQIMNHHPLLHPHSGSTTTAKGHNAQQVRLQQLLNQPDLRSLANSKGQNRNQGMNTVLNSVGSSDLGNSDGVITDASFDSTFDHSISSQQDCEFSDDDLEKSLEFQIDPETEHQASRLLEDNELTEDDLNELFPETNNKLARSDLSDLGDFSSAFDANDIDYSLFANIFPFNRSAQSETISISNQY